MHPKLVMAVLCAATLAPAAVSAQRPAAPDPKAAVAPHQYESAFSSYKPYEEQALRPWRELNQEVEKAGGHIGIFGGAGQAGHGATKPPAPGPKVSGESPPRSGSAVPASKPHH